MKRLYGCFARNNEEIDTQEFEVSCLVRFVELLQKAHNQRKQIHLNYFDSEDDLDLWLEVK